MDELIEMYRICENENKPCADCDSCVFRSECFLVEELEEDNKNE